ncbi:MAG: SDR family oxidoreductase [Sphingomonadales bacterium]|nr:SDR family oxidoreductase [Sphingomonadales bacterium]
MLSLENRTCLVTGASSGLGAHFVRLLVGAGARVVLAARRLDRIAALSEELGANALAVEMDVTSEASTVAAFDAAATAFGPVDTVIANAGISVPGRAVEIPEDAVKALIGTNVVGVYLTAREAARRMIAAGCRESGRGRILLVGSMGADSPIAGEAAYCASKAAVATLGRNLAREWIRQGICVNVIQPGFILTEMAADWFGSAGGEKQIDGFPRRRLQPIESLDAPVLYFCSDAARSATGAILTIDDGQSL